MNWVASIAAIVGLLALGYVFYIAFGGGGGAHWGE